ncbi:hypothetical protein SY88_11440 [Clostridiales bacterium PH28_bin88]|nr:hypothetical protein SY88_11440 [Clostridiales bacterium PH28_bin88]
MRLWYDERGFTLVEMVVTSLILVLALGGTYTLLFGGLNSFRMGEARVDNQQNVRAALNSILREVRSARKVYPQNSIYADIEGIRYYAGPLNLFIEDSGKRTIVYYWKNKEIRRSVKDAGGISYYGHNAIAYEVPGDGLSFEYSGDPIKTVTVRVKAVDSQDKEFVLSSKSTLRVLGN